MTFHPQQVHWFEAKIPRNQSVFALEKLAGSGSVQLEDRDEHDAPCIDTAYLRRQLGRLDELRSRYAADLPPPDPYPEKIVMEPERLADTIVSKIREWAGILLRSRRQLRQAELEFEHLTLLGGCIEAMGDDSDQLAGLSGSGELFYKHIFTCPPGEIRISESDKDVFESVYRGPKHDFWIAIGSPDREKILDSTAALANCTPLEIPAWLPDDSTSQAAMVAERLRHLDAEKLRLRTLLDELHSSPDISTALGHARLLRWYLGVFIESTPDHSACRLTGWTTAASPMELEQQLQVDGIDASFIFSPPRSDLKPPMNLTTSGWNRPFRLFVDLMGSPGENEIDPTPLVAFMVPLLFGFMFPDLGHGLVLAIAGWFYSRRKQSALILVHCGIAAAGFGILFGEVFGMHDLIPSICGCPLENPVSILITSMLLGVAIIILGLVFSGIEAWWCSDMHRWSLEEAPVILLYLSAALAIVLPQAVIISIAALLWYLSGSVVLCRQKGSGCLFTQLGRLAESSFQLLVASLSFLRVGAFALAHSTFSLVVIEFISRVESGFMQALIFVAGHLFIIVLEGLIVMVQTTRLVLFEFFTRFLRFEGRVYKPLQRPGAESSH